MERKPSGSYGHHRQTSIVHGNIQHSRNTSFASTPTTSPLTPQVIAELGGATQHVLDSRMMATDGVGNLPSLNNGYIGGAGLAGQKGHSPSASFGDRTGTEPMQGATYRRPERMHSGRSSRAHNHTRSQSRSLHHQQVTVSEYALHHLFNSV